MSLFIYITAGQRTFTSAGLDPQPGTNSLWLCVFVFALGPCDCLRSKCVVLCKYIVVFFVVCNCAPWTVSLSVMGSVRLINIIIIIMIIMSPLAMFSACRARGDPATVPGPGHPPAARSPVLLPPPAHRRGRGRPSRPPHPLRSTPADQSLRGALLLVPGYSGM